MASLKNAYKVGQRIHRERAQPDARKEYGLLEKKKDYKKRAVVRQEHEETLKKLRKHALDRNPDEFHHHMVNSETKEGQHYEKEKEDEDTILQKTFGEIKDLSYVKHKLQEERKKIALMQAELHLADTATSSTKRNTHTIFVDDDKAAKSFNPAEYFDTEPELLGRQFNRMKKGDLTNKTVTGAWTKDDVKEVERLRHVRYNELAKRIAREQELAVVVAKLELKKNLGSVKGELKPKKVRKGNATRASVYKFTTQRKR